MSCAVAAMLSVACSPMAPLTVPTVPSTSSPALQPVVDPAPETAAGVARPPLTPRGGERFAVFGHERASSEVRAIADWVVDSDDTNGLPFVIVDKTNARVLVFDAEGQLRGASPALLGAAKGDDSTPGIGERPMADIRAEERTTPAGRFAAEMGRNATGEDIVWVDYDNAVSMHRVRATNPAERRLQRLASPTPKDNRISYGCINLPAAFYDEVLKPAFFPRAGIVYVLPETRPAQPLFRAYRVERKVPGPIAQK